MMILLILFAYFADLALVSSAVIGFAATALLFAVVHAMQIAPAIRVDSRCRLLYTPASCPCGRGGIGRRAALRSLWGNSRGSSSLLDRTIFLRIAVLLSFPPPSGRV
jgi:hypothetical protein